jgi:hypothetical protein
VGPGEQLRGVDSSAQVRRHTRAVGWCAVCGPGARAARGAGRPNLGYRARYRRYRPRLFRSRLRPATLPRTDSVRCPGVRASTPAGSSARAAGRPRRRIRGRLSLPGAHARIPATVGAAGRAVRLGGGRRVLVSRGCGAPRHCGSRREPAAHPPWAAASASRDPSPAAGFAGACRAPHVASRQNGAPPGGGPVHAACPLWRGVRTATLPRPATPAHLHLAPHTLPRRSPVACRKWPKRTSAAAGLLPWTRGAGARTTCTWRRSRRSGSTPRSWRRRRRRAAAAWAAAPTAAPCPRCPSRWRPSRSRCCPRGGCRRSTPPAAGGTTRPRRRASRSGSRPRRRCRARRTGPCLRSPRRPPSRPPASGSRPPPAAAGSACWTTPAWRRRRRWPPRARSLRACG